MSDKHPTAGGHPAIVPGFFATFVPGRKGQILDAALAVFGEKGYEAGTLREIALIVGVSEPALYRHYSSKEALLIALVETAGRRMAETAAERLEHADVTTPAATVGMLVRDRRDVMQSNLALMRTMIVAAHHNDAAREAFQRAMTGPMMAALRQYVTRVDAARGITRSAAEVDTSVRLIMSLVIGHFLTSRFLNDEGSDSSVADAIMRMMGWYDSGQ